MADEHYTFLPLPPEDALQGEVVVSAGLPEHALVAAASENAAQRLGDNEVLQHVEPGQPEPHGQGGAQERLPYKYWKRTGP